MSVWLIDLLGVLVACELSETLTAAGFKDIEIKPTFGFMSIVTGCKG